jgi:hypothetical protein
VLHVNIEQECLRDECDWTGSEGLREFPEAGTLIYFIFSTWYDFARINGERELPLFFSLFSFLQVLKAWTGHGVGALVVRFFGVLCALEHTTVKR